MFYVLKIQKRSNTVFEELFGGFIKDRYDVRSVPVYKGAPFMTMTVTVGKRGVNWNDVSRILGKCALRLIVNECVTLPQNNNFGHFKSCALYDKMMKNTILQILDNSFKKKTISISVADEKGKYTDFVKKLSQYADALTIATQNEKKYLELCEEITDECGLCPVLTEESKNSRIKINCDKNQMTIRCENRCYVLNCGSEFTVPEIYRKLLPNGVNKYDFYSALYELCGIFTLDELCFENIMVNNEKKSVSTLSFT